MSMHSEVFVGFARSARNKRGRCVCLDREGERVLEVTLPWRAKALTQVLEVISARAASVYVGLQLDDLDRSMRRALRRAGSPARIFFAYAVDAQALGVERRRFTIGLRARCVAQLLYVRRQVDADTALAWHPRRRCRALSRGTPPPSSHREHEMETLLSIAEICPRFAHLRVRTEAREKRLMTSMAKVGQRVPVLVTPLKGLHVLIDGYKRFVVAQKLRLEHLKAQRIEVDEIGALVCIAKAQESTRLTAVEDGFIFWTLQMDHELSLDRIGELFDRDKTFIQRRIALVRDFSSEILDQVRTGKLSPSTLRVLFPIAREDGHAAQILAQACADAKLTSREAARIARAYLALRTVEQRDQLLRDPRAFLLREELRRSKDHDPSLEPHVSALLAGLKEIGHRARALSAALRSPALRPLIEPVRARLFAAWLSARPELELFDITAKEVLS